MQRRYQVLIVIVAVILVVALYVWIAKPTLVLPTITVSLSQNDPLGQFQRQLKANELTVRVRTDGKVVINADGQPLANVSYDIPSLATATDLAFKTAMPPTAKTTMTVLQYIFPQLTWNLYISGLSMYYTLPVEITLRFIPG